MRWASVISERGGLEGAIEEATHLLHRALGGRAPDLVLAFLGGYAPAAVRQHGARIYERLPQAAVLGCTAGAVIGGGSEVEQSPAVALVGACLPGVELSTFRLGPLEMDPSKLSAESWRRRLGVDPEHQPAFLLLPEPQSCDIDRLISSLDLAYPGAPKVGGVASGARQPERNTLILDDELVDGGVVGVAMVGDLRMDAVVAQGARPLGEPMTVTRCDRHLISELDGVPAVQVLDTFFATLSPEDRALFQRGPLLGVGVDPAKETFRSGDFLIRNLLGLDRQRGVLGVGATLRPGQVVQFHARDASAASEELHELLGRYQREQGAEAPAGALMFSCLGRGSGFYGVPDHDSRVLREVLGPVPAGGFFCGGEIGPVHQRSFLHAYTSSIALFRPRGWD